MEGLDSRRHNLLFVIPSLRGGGTERVIATLLRYLNTAQFNISLVVLDLRGAVYLDLIPPDVELIDLNVRRARFAFPKLIWLVWKKRPDVVFSFFGYLNIGIALFRSFLPRGVKLLGRENVVVGRYLSEIRGGYLWEVGYRCLYPRLDHVVCQSSDMKNDLVVRYRFPEERIGVIHNPVDVDYIRCLAAQPCLAWEGREDAGSDVVRFVAAGRLERQKGFDLLIEAIALLGNRQVFLCILGEGELAEELGCLAKSLGVGDLITFVGFQKNPYAWFAKADAFVLSSRYEGFPNVVLEALTCGTPVIATPAPGGVSEILEGVIACELADEISAPSLAEAMQRWLERRPGRINSSVVEPYLASTIAKTYENAILRVMAKG